MQERVTTTKTADGKTILTKVTTIPGLETEEIEEECTETVAGESKTNKTKSQVVKSPFAVSRLPGGLDVSMKEPLALGQERTEFDKTTNTTIVTKRIANGYEQTFTTITPEGKTKVSSKTFFDPVAVQGEEEEEEIEEYAEIETHGKGATQATILTSKPVAAKPQVKEQTNKSKDSKSVTKVATNVVSKDPKTSTTIKEIPRGKQEITETVTPDGKSQTKIRTIYDPEEQEETEEYEETHTFEEQPKRRTTTTTTVAKNPAAPVAPKRNATSTTVAVAPNGGKPADNVRARKVVTKGDEEIEITEEHTETEFTPTRKTTVNTSVTASNPNAPKLDPKGKTTVTKVVIPGSQSTTNSRSNLADGKQIVSKKLPSGTQEISKTTAPDGTTKMQVTTTVKPEELHIEETETTNIIGDKTITTTRTEVPIPGKRIVKQLPPQKVEGSGTKTKTTTTTTTMPVGEDKITTTTKRVDKGTETSVKTETKDGKSKTETRTKFDPIFYPAESEDEEIEEYEEETQTFAPVKTKTTTTTRIPATDANKKKPDASSSKPVQPVPPPRKKEVKSVKK